MLYLAIPVLSSLTITDELAIVLGVFLAALVIAALIVVVTLLTNIKRRPIIGKITNVEIIEFDDDSAVTLITLKVGEHTKYFGVAGARTELTIGTEEFKVMPTFDIIYEKDLHRDENPVPRKVIVVPETMEYYRIAWYEYPPVIVPDNEVP